jgi:hypothetical protein
MEKSDGGRKRGGPRAGAGRHRPLTENQEIWIGAFCEDRWNKIRHKLGMDDFWEDRKLPQEHDERLFYTVRIAPPGELPREIRRSIPVQRRREAAKLLLKTAKLNNGDNKLSREDATQLLKDAKLTHMDALIEHVRISQEIFGARSRFYRVKLPRIHGRGIMDDVVLEAMVQAQEKWRIAISRRRVRACWDDYKALLRATDPEVTSGDV